MFRTVFFILLFSLALNGFAQNSGGIRGQVMDSEMMDEPMLFANVKLKGTDKSVQTNFHGNFEFSEVNAGNYTLVISYPGYETREVDVIVRADNISDIQEEMVARTIDVGAVLASEATVTLSEARDVVQPEK